MRKAKKSVRVEAAALFLFIAVLAVYATFFTINSNVNAAGGDDAANAGCQQSWNNFKQQAEQNPSLGDPTQYADQKNAGVPCKAEGGSGHCNAKEGSQSPKDICGAEKDQKGEPLKMPEIPKKEPKKEEDKKPCDPGIATSTSARTYGLQNQYASSSSSLLNQQPCPQGSQNTLSNFSPAGLWDQIQQAFTNSFGGSSASDSATETTHMTAEEEVQAIIDAVNQNSSVPSSAKNAYAQALQEYVTAARAVGNTQSVIEIVKENIGTGKYGDTTSIRPLEDIYAGAQEVESDLAQLAARAGALNELVPAGGVEQGDANIISIVGSVIEGWFSNIRNLFGL